MPDNDEAKDHDPTAEKRPVARNLSDMLQALRVLLYRMIVFGMDLLSRAHSGDGSRRHPGAGRCRWYRGRGAGSACYRRMVVALP
jgi:hypothetical protein